jgi:plasmid stabilization system protein ParE
VEVEFHPEAQLESNQAALHYRESSVVAALRFVRELNKAFTKIENSPERWPPWLNGTRRLVIAKFPFSVIYRILPDRVRILAVAHERRHPEYWQNRQ